jgi:5-methylcytosine-specific restriction protein A
MNAKHARDVKAGKHPASATRSGKWRSVRAAHLKRHPKCYVCLGKKKVEVHHKKPFHLHPALELDPKNLITLCENDNDGINCHLAFGHLGNFKSYNVDVTADAAEWRMKILKRP